MAGAGRQQETPISNTPPWAAVQVRTTNQVRRDVRHSVDLFLGQFRIQQVEVNGGSTAWLEVVPVAGKDSVEAIPEQRVAQVAKQRCIMAIRLGEDLQSPPGSSAVGPAHARKHPKAFEFADDIILFAHSGKPTPSSVDCAVK